MANIEFTDYRPRGLGQASPLTSVNEGGPLVAFTNIVDEIGPFPTGIYKFTTVIDFTLPDTKHVDVVIEVNGTSGKTYRLESTVSSPLVNDFTLVFFIPIATPGSGINMGMTVFFPDQAGANTCVVDSYQFAYEKWTDL